MLAATVPWTYWMSFPLLAAVVVALVVFLVGYYRRILVPSFEWRVYQLLSARQAQVSSPTLALREGGRTAKHERPQLRRAA